MSTSPDAAALHHIIVVGGTVAEWAAMTDEQWSTRLEELGKVADHDGARWLTLRPYGPGDGPVADLPVRERSVGSCTVSARPDADGRRRVADAAAELHRRGRAITESSVAALLNEPAEVDPDLVLVLGDPNHLPPSLVWELAYSELVFLPVSWAQLTAGQLEDAVSSFAHRNRRFGGIDA